MLLEEFSIISLSSKIQVLRIRVWVPYGIERVSITRRNLEEKKIQIISKLLHAPPRASLAQEMEPLNHNGLYEPQRQMPPQPVNLETLLQSGFLQEFFSTKIQKINDHGVSQ